EGATTREPRSIRLTSNHSARSWGESLARPPHPTRFATLRPRFFAGGRGASGVGLGPSFTGTVVDGHVSMIVTMTSSTYTDENSVLMMPPSVVTLALRNTDAVS